MKKRTPVSQIMTSNPLSVNENNSVSDVAELFKNNDIHHIPVVSGKELKGLISKSDIDRISFILDSTTDKVNTQIYDGLDLEQVMTSEVLTADVDDPIKEVAEKLATGTYHALPVLEKNELAGIVTSTDLIKYLVEQY